MVNFIGLFLCSVSLEKSVSRVVAKSLDAICRILTFKSISIFNMYKQEKDKASLLSNSKIYWIALYSVFIQRSPFILWNICALLLCMNLFILLFLPKHIKSCEYVLLFYCTVVLKSCCLLFKLFHFCTCFYWLTKLFSMLHFKAMFSFLHWLRSFLYIFSLYVRVVYLNIFNLYILYIMYTTCFMLFNINKTNNASKVFDVTSRAKMRTPKV
jgi:hypothetical protein